FDGFMSGEISPGWFYSVGGFYRTDQIRNPQFPANQGGQLTATLTHDLKHGSIMFYVRDLNDRNQFLTDVPLIVSPNGQNLSSFPGFSALTG
ncbi:TonB-dependent outer membrane receptor, partial [mine drainage metagenome]